MAASEEDKLPESEVLAQVASYPRSDFHSANTMLTFSSVQMSYVVHIFQSPILYSHLRPRTLTFAAMDTTSNAIARTLGILAAQPEAQDRVRQEILDALGKKEGQDLSYDELVSLPFLDAVCRETLRLWVRCPSFYYSVL
jgi:Cytochrome P450